MSDQEDTSGSGSQASDKEKPNTRTPSQPMSTGSRFVTFTPISFWKTSLCFPHLTSLV